MVVRVAVTVPVEAVRMAPRGCNAKRCPESFDLPLQPPAGYPPIPLSWVMLRVYSPPTHLDVEHMLPIAPSALQCNDVLRQLGRNLPTIREIDANHPLFAMHRLDTLSLGSLEYDALSCEQKAKTIVKQLGSRKVQLGGAHHLGRCGVQPSGADFDQQHLKSWAGGGGSGLHTGWAFWRKLFALFVQRPQGNVFLEGKSGTVVYLLLFLRKVKM